MVGRAVGIERTAYQSQAPLRHCRPHDDPECILSHRRITRIQRLAANFFIFQKWPVMSMRPVSPAEKKT
jgi:hypothetical protein